MTSEKSIEAELKKQVKKLHGLSFKWVSPGFNGVPDQIVLLPWARIYLVETKTIGGKISPIQRVVHKLLAAIGFPVRVVWTIEQVKDFIYEVGL